MPSLLIEEDCILRMVVTKTLRELFLRRIGQCPNEGKQYLPCFGLGFECCATDDDTLHVEVAHLEPNTHKYRDISTEAIAGHGKDGVPQPFKKLFSFTIVQRTFFIDILPPEILFLVGITKEDDTPCGVVRAFAEVCGINDEEDRSWVGGLCWDDNCVDNRYE